MNDGDFEGKIRLWVSTLLWLRLRGRCWKKSESGQAYSVEYNKQEENEWFKQIPEEHQEMVKKVATKERKRLKALEKRTGKKYGVLLVNEQIQL